MCLVIGIAVGGVAILATDLRHSLREGEGRVFADAGGKLQPVPGGWATTTGSAALGAVGLGAIAGVGLSDPARVVGALGHAHRSVTAALPEDDQWAKTHWIAVRHGSDGLTAHGWDWRGAHLPDSGPDTLFTTWPPAETGLPQQALRAEFRRRIGRGNAFEITRAIGWLFGEVAALADSCSPEFEAGALLPDGRRVCARLGPEWQGASDAEILKRFFTGAQTLPRSTTEFQTAVMAAKIYYEKEAWQRTR